MYTKQFLIVTLCLLLLGTRNGYAQYPDKEVHKNILSPERVTAICKDSAGFIWVGTDDGIKKYGSDLKYRFPPRDPYLWEDINTLICVSGHKLLAGNKRGLWMCKEQDRKLVQICTEEIKFPVLSLANHQKDGVYIGTSNGLYCFEPHSEKLTHVFSGIELEKVLSPILHISVDTHGIVWLLTNQDILSYNPRNKDVQRYKPPTGYSLNCAIYTGGKLYVGTEQGAILRFDPARPVFSKLADLGDPVSCLASYNPDVLVAGTEENGLSFISLTSQAFNTLRHNPQDHTGLSSNSVSALFVDEYKNTWIGYRSHIGLDVLTDKEPLFKTYSSGSFSTKHIPVRSFFIDGRQIKLIGTRKGLYYINEKEGHPRLYDKRKGLRSDIIFSITKYDGKYFIGTCKGGVSVLNPETHTISALQDYPALLEGDIFSFYQDQRSRLWIASTNGIHCYNKSDHSLKSYTSTNSGLLSNFVLYIYKDSQNRTWICTSKGICLLNTDSDKIIPAAEINHFTSHEGIRSVFEDAEGTLYFGTSKRKLLQVDKTLAKYTYIERTPEGTIFKDNPFFEIPWNGVLDNKGNIWMISLIGIIQADKAMKNWKLHVDKEGLPGNIVTDGSTCFKDPQGRLWFANTNGLVYIDSIPPAPGFPENRLFIDYITVNGTERFMNDGTQNNRFILAHTQNHIRFHVVSLNYEWNGGRPVYEYKLEGADSIWNRTEGPGDIEYSNLSAGEYTFRIRECMNPGSVRSLNVEIKAGIFSGQYIVIILILVLLAAFVFAYRKYKPSGISRESSGSGTWNVKRQAPEEKYRNIKISESRANEIIKALTQYMEKEKPYTDPNLKIHDVATAIGCTAPILSQLFNQHLHIRFYDYMAKYRIEEFKRLIEEEDYTSYTLTALGEKSGFNSQASFFKSFKKNTGLTPKEYIKTKKR